LETIGEYLLMRRKKERKVCPIIEMDSMKNKKRESKAERKMTKTQRKNKFEGNRA